MVKVLDDQVSGRSRTKDEKRLAEAEERRLNELKSKETDQLEKERAAKELERQKCLASDLNVRGVVIHYFCQFLFIFYIIFFSFLNRNKKRKRLKEDNYMNLKNF